MRSTLHTAADTDMSTARHDWRLVPAALVTWFGALCGLLWGWWAAALCGGVAAVTALAVAGRAAVLRRAGWVRGAGPAMGALLVCGIAVAGPVSARLSDAERDPLRAAAGSATAVTLRGTVSERPRPVRSAGYGDQPGGRRSVLVPLDVSSAVVAERTVSASGSVLLVASSAATELHGWADVLPGQEVTARGELAPARPHELTVAVAFVRGPPEDVGPAPWWQHAAEDVRAALRAVCGVLEPESAGLLPGLVVGDTSGQSPRVEREFRDAGLSHLTAVSGSNVAIVCGAVLLVARTARLGPRVSALCAGAALLGFVVLVGSEPSVLRAGVMGAVGLLALVLGRRGSALPALAAAVVLVVLADPGMATSLGFALSVVATAGLVLLAPRVAGALGRRGLPVGLAHGLAVPAVAFVATAPVLAGAVGEVSVVSVAANVLVSPVVAPVTVLGATATVLAPVWAPAAEILVHAAAPGVHWLLIVARQASAVPGAVLPWPSGWWGGVLAAVAVVAATLLLCVRWGRIMLAAALAAVLVVLVPTRVIVPAWPPKGWSLVACDVGQGDALVLATGNPGAAVVVDTGAEPGPLDRCLDRLGVDRVPLVVLSHLHADHVGGLAAVFDGRTVGAVAVGQGRAPRWAWRQVYREATTREVPVVGLRPNDRLAWAGLRLEVLGPAYVPADQRGVGGADGAGAGAAETEGTPVNNTSVVVLATTEAGRVLLTGDIERAAQADLLAGCGDLRAEVLKVPHHGGRDTSASFLAAVAPRVALISVGADNRYGHPNPVTVRALASSGTLVARTDTGGDLAVVSDRGAPAVVRRGPSAVR